MIIGITTTFIKKYAIQRVTTPYIKCVQKAGGIPILLPPLAEEEKIDELLAHLDGIVLTGGGDIDPSLYGDETRIPETNSVSLIRDHFELQLTKKAYEQDLPLFGICRGVQVMNVALGGTLYQDVRACGVTTENHFQEKPFDKVWQEIRTIPGTRLAQILASQTKRPHLVNSIHHQAVRGIAPGLVIDAYSKDGVIEGIEDPMKHFFIGVQWHPEYLENDSVLFKAFCDTAQELKKRKTGCSKSA